MGRYSWWRRLAFSLEGRCQGEWGSAKKTGVAVAREALVCWAVSLPWSHASDAFIVCASSLK